MIGMVFFSTHYRVMTKIRASNCATFCVPHGNSSVSFVIFPILPSFKHIHFIFSWLKIIFANWWLLFIAAIKFESYTSWTFFTFTWTKVSAFVKHTQFHGDHSNALFQRGNLQNRKQEKRIKCWNHHTFAHDFDLPQNVSIRALT